MEVLNNCFVTCFRCGQLGWCYNRISFAYYRPAAGLLSQKAYGVIHSGLTYRQMNSLVASMEVKGLHYSAITRREGEIHPHFQEIANESCSAVLQEEVKSSSPT